MTGKLRILVVDDEQVILDSARKILGSDLTVLTAPDAEAASQLLAAEALLAQAHHQRRELLVAEVAQVDSSARGSGARGSGGRARGLARLKGFKVHGGAV